MRPILILITVFFTAQLNVQATPNICWAVVDKALGPSITGVEAGLFFLDHLVDAAACTLVGFMFQKVHKNFMALTTTNKQLS
ncbi:MAG: hypothetical protein IPN76_15555 [Saprospiraceae bacterium]|jgi:hypothetical protein|nr:hypothetical protein [Saprospiraceae bacterium]